MSLRPHHTLLCPSFDTERTGRVLVRIGPYRQHEKAKRGLWGSRDQNVSGDMDNRKCPNARKNAIKNPDIIRHECDGHAEAPGQDQQVGIVEHG